MEQNIINKELSGEIKRQLSIFLLPILLLTFFLTLSHSCKDPVEPEPNLKISGVSIPSSIYVNIESEITITGKGFMEGDYMKLVSSTDTSVEYKILVSSVGEQSVSFFIPIGFTTGSYQISVIRGDESQLLGIILINVTDDSEIPDVEGMTIKGRVYCNGIGIPGVSVSDGYELAVTDKDGIYYLPSEKKNKYVFISIPGNYEVPYTQNLPQFFKRLVGGTTVEQKDFSLIESDNSKHVVLTMADWHLANRNDDITQFSDGFLQDINATIAAYTAEGTKVYGLTLGDMTWDLYWYSNYFALPEYLAQMYKINCPIFNLIGNHDNDPYKAADWDAEQAYKDNVCPNYYSFNLGDIHYIVLDDIEYINTGGSQGVIGERNYDNRISSDQMEWLSKDLATIEDPNTPIVIGMHIPMYKQPVVDENGEYTAQIHLDNGSAFTSLLEPFSNIHVISGHAHRNFTVEPSESIMEHNTGAVCATWWWTGKPGYANNHICGDGSPGGYGIWEVNGREQEWYYKGIGYERNYQFRTYDLNTTHITAAKFAPNSSDELLAEYAGEYASPSIANEVLLNIWAYEKNWTIQVTENGSKLNVTQLNGKDPLHIISYEALRLDHGATPTSSFVTENTPHLFKVKASSPTSTLEIKITDSFGNIYSETMERPKAFTWEMR